MAARKKTTPPAQELEVTTAQVQEPAQVPEAITPEPEPTPAEKAPSFPFKATVCVELAILRRDIPPATAEMLNPVATLPQGTTVTITAIQDGYARLRNGLWISAAHITR